MLVKIDGYEIVEADITLVSLVKRGANRSPFKIVKSAEPNAGNPTVMPDRPYHNGGVDTRYPLGRPDDAWFKKSGLDALIADAHRRRRGGGW
jgi:hypothetical protein